MKKLLLSLLAVFLFSSHAYASSIVIEAETGKVLYEHNADSKRRPASLTKMMTLYLTFEALKKGRLTLNHKMKVSRLAASRSPSKLYLKRGQTIKVKDAINALITKSANDVATVIAEELGGGSEKKFAIMMTNEAHRLGMARTRFRNASGLPHWLQTTTARDMAILGQALIRDFPHEYKRFSLASFSFNDKVYRNHNHLLSCYGDVDGIKTGYTRTAGFNLVASAEIDGKRLIGVVMGYNTKTSRDKRMVQLLNQGFTKLEKTPTKLSRNCQQADR